MKRRAFLRTVACAALSAGCAPAFSKAALPAEEPVPRADARGPRVWAWLRMMATKGEYAVPTSEASYDAHASLIDAVMPLNGGKLQADGSWLQEPWKTETPFAQSLRGAAKRAGQWYLPGVGNDPDGIRAVLESPALIARAAENLARLSIERFDAPWDGVMLDLEQIPFEYSARLSKFLAALVARLRAAGKRAGISVRGRAADTGNDPPDAYTFDFSVVADLADTVDLRCYDHWSPRPRSIGPAWWQAACVDYALSKGIPRSRLALGPGCFAKYWFDSDEAHADQITYARALEVIAAAGSAAEWIETGPLGPVRELFAPVGEGHIWLRDARTCRHALNLIDERDILGVSLFAPGMEDPLQWKAIREWLYPLNLRLPMAM